MRCLYWWNQAGWRDIWFLYVLLLIRHARDFFSTSFSPPSCWGGEWVSEWSGGRLAAGYCQPATPASQSQHCTERTRKELLCVEKKSSLRTSQWQNVQVYQLQAFSSDIWACGPTGRELTADLLFFICKEASIAFLLHLLVGGLVCSLTYHLTLSSRTVEEKSFAVSQPKLSFFLYWLLLNNQLTFGTVLFIIIQVSSNVI